MVKTLVGQWFVVQRFTKIDIYFFLFCAALSSLATCVDEIITTFSDHIKKIWEENA